jgi:RNA polymerase sigma-70 factor, ECF subfamily
MSVPAERSAVESFEAHRSALTGLAYRMLGSRAEADDVVQDAYLRWHTVDSSTIEEPRRYLGTVVTRLCLDRMKSAKARHEIYVGQWLPEPVVDEVFDSEAADDIAHDLSIALMMVLERLSPLERAAFLLHDAFGLDFGDVAAALGRGEAACRQLAARARAHIEARRPRFPASREEGHRLAAAFREAAESGDAQALARLLAEDAVLYGRRRQARRRLQADLWRGQDFAVHCRRLAQEPRSANDAGARRDHQWAGRIRHARSGRVDQHDGLRVRIVAIYVVRNPEKLRHVQL